MRRRVGDDPPGRRAGPRARTAGAASGRSWVTTSIVRSTRSSVSISSRRVRGSRFADGSSSTSRLGRIASTVAIATRRRWPSESWCGARSAELGHAHGGERLVQRGPRPRAREAEVERPERDVLADGRHEELVVGVLEDEPDAGAQVAHVVGADAQPGDLEPARRRRAARSGAASASSCRRRWGRARRRARRGPRGGRRRRGRRRRSGSVKRRSRAWIAQLMRRRSGLEQESVARAPRKSASARRKASTSRRGIAWFKPRATIARWTRSARS